MQIEKGSKKDKIPQFLAHDLPVFDHTGLYLLENTIDKKTQRMFLVVLVLVLVFLMFFNLYPFWMQQAIWSMMCYYAISYFGIGALRLLCWIIGFHFGVRFWLFPNYRKSYNVFKFMFPLTSMKVREDAYEPRSMVFRAISISMAVYMGFTFLQDE